MSRCRSCGAEIVWTTTESGRKMPLDAEPVKRAVQVAETALSATTRNPFDMVVSIRDTYTPHFATCSEGQEWSGKGRSA